MSQNNKIIISSTSGWVKNESRDLTSHLMEFLDSLCVSDLQRGAVKQNVQGKIDQYIDIYGQPWNEPFKEPVHTGKEPKS